MSIVDRIRERGSSRDLDADRIGGIDLRLGSKRRSQVRVLLSPEHPRGVQLDLLGLLERGGHLTDMVTSISNLANGMMRHLADLKRESKIGTLSWPRFRESGHVVDFDPPAIDEAAIPVGIYIVSVERSEESWRASLKLGYPVLAVRLDIELSRSPQAEHRRLLGLGVSPYVDVTEFRSVEAEPADVGRVARYFDR